VSKRLLKSGIIVSAMTLISRVLGLVRDVVVANLMGAGASADVFFFANRIPNFLRRLFAEGAFSQAFVPVLTEYHASGDINKTRELIARASGTLGVLVTLVTLVGVLGSGAVTALFGAGWFLDWLNDGPAAGKFELASLLLKITFPYLWFITFVALSGAILNTLGKFAVASFTPVFLNVMMILCAWYLSPNLAQPEIGLAIGVFLGGLVQFLFQLPFLIKAGVLVKPKWAWRDPGVVKIRTLMIPALFGVSVSQINLLFDSFVASFLQTGSISWLYYSDRLLEFPLGLFGIAIATVILPALSRKHVNAHSAGFAHTMDWGIRMVMFLGIPAMLIKILAPGYYSRQDIKTPVRYGIIAMLSNIVLNAIFAWFYGYVGLAIATSMSALLNMTLLYGGLHRQGVYQLTSQTLWFVLRLIIAGAVMTGIMLWQQASMATWLSWGISQRALILSGLIVLGAASYLAVLLLLGIRLKHLKAATE